MNQDAVDYFRVDFTPGESIVGGKRYPLGTFAVEMMECGWNRAAEIRQPLKRFQEEFQVFLAARDVSSAATAFHAMRELWQVLGKLPVYNKLMVEGHRLPGLIPYLRGHQDLLDEMLTPGDAPQRGIYPVEGEAGASGGRAAVLCQKHAVDAGRVLSGTAVQKAAGLYPGLCPIPGCDRGRDAGKAGRGG